MTRKSGVNKKCDVTLSGKRKTRGQTEKKDDDVCDDNGSMKVERVGRGQ